MTTTPPGWYPDPAPVSPGPARERWWDGTAWSAQTRARAPVRGPLAAGVVGVLVLTSALVVGGLLFFVAGAGDEPSAPDPARPPGHGGPSGPPDGAGPDAAALGVRLPALPGWQRDPGGASAVTGPYTCPGEAGGQCLRGAATILPSPSGGTLREIAAADVERYATEAYSEETYGGITGHRVLRSERTTVAGQAAYRVRWRITNRIEPDAYLESVAFVQPHADGRTLVLRASVDDHEDAPPPSVLDKLTREAEPSGRDGGDGAAREAAVARPDGATGRAFPARPAGPVR